ncbi:MAG: TlpA family protein disulfide reductase [Desulfobulbaceae bacterium]|nr:TlpA family protein disulfide reductase [Desulfobulbaceae bacterium]
MKKFTFLPLSVFIVFFFFTGISIAETKTEIAPLPDVTLTIPENKAYIDYLGLKGEPGTPFKLSDIDADVLMIELFSMYCPYCQKAAPAVNELYELLEQKKRPDLKLVIIGIGANNTDLEVETFRQGFKIAFPLFSDPDLSIYKILEGAGTPTFIGCKKDGDKKVIFFRKSGGFTDPPEFLDNLLNSAGLK